ncbi:conserved hypothetical protein [Sulfurimonas denitrificans DSM 1251]|uniref:Periplasmic protein n=1 Tax=Sulfurimonas denitrificans (strain ATCC 33889 / DSM 1251) TaxID=326298 RepID=Q30PA1_SULDN|nr:hypothetical protein [Sulfurimonas denitrificans]ABB45180.1 conserved hypothetical protein [Sulfurimonas denitrificans DSM 1251]
MVKIFFLILFLFSSLHAQDLLIKKIQNLVSPKTFAKDRAFIETIFSPKSEFYNSNGAVDSIKVIKTLKENGILNLFFQKPRDINISFKTNGEALFFIKIMSDALQNIGYYKYVTKESSLDGEEFVWKINLTSEYAADPIILSQELKKNGCQISDVVRENESDWSYVVDMKNAKLDVSTLEGGVTFSLKRSLYAYWLDVSNVESVDITSSLRNDWYPYIAFYDKSLKLLSVIKLDTKKTEITIDINSDVRYIKISDIYTLKNIKDDLVLLPRERKY